MFYSRVSSLSKLVMLLVPYALIIGCHDTSSTGRVGDTNHTSNAMTPHTHQGYGEELIGFRNGQVSSEETGNTIGGANQASPIQGDSAPSEEVGALPEGEDTYNEEPPPPPEPTFSAQIDADFLAQLRTDEAQWGFVYEGVLGYGSRYDMSRSWWLNLEGEMYESEDNLMINYVGEELAADAQAYIGTSSDFTGPIQFEEYLKVQSRLALSINAEPSELLSLNQGARTVVTQETYQTQNGERALRESCVVASHTSDQEGETHYAIQADELISEPFVSIASVTPLSALDNSSNEDVNALLDLDEEAEPRERCQCFDESGETEIDCDEFYRDIDPNIPAEIPFYTAAESPLSTFSLDVDTASYTLVRQALNQGTLP